LPRFTTSVGEEGLNPSKSEDLLVGIYFLLGLRSGHAKVHEHVHTNSKLPTHPSLAKLFLELLRQIGISRYVTLRIHAPIDGYERYRQHWKKTLGIDRFEKPITTESRGREIKSGIIHIRIYRAVIRELFLHWTRILHRLLEISHDADSHL
jgi:hypothetical protein